MEEIFRKSLKKTDVTSRLSAPVESLRKLWHFEGRRVVGTIGVPCGGNNGPFRKPVLSGDWRRFAQSKRLSIGDEVRLLKEIDQATGQGLHYRVEMRKTIIRLFGVSIQHPPVLLQLIKLD